MILRDKNILLISPEAFDHIFVSKHHYATHLAALGNKVFFLNPPKNKGISCISTNYENLYEINYNGFIKGLRLFPTFLQRFLIKRKFNALQNICHTNFDVIWSFDNSVFFDFTGLCHQVFCISHIVDWNQHFELEKASKTANLCLSTSNNIWNKQKIHNDNSYNIGHGFNIKGSKNIDFPLQKKYTINCGYAGNLDIKYISWAVIKELIESFPSVGFHFAGPWETSNNFNELVNEPNFHYYGKLVSDELNSFYSTMDLLLLAYNYKKYPEQLSNPHKMMEYLASGKMIVANYTKEYNQKLPQSVKFIYEETEFISEFSNVISEIDKWNSPDLRYQRMNFTKNFSYNKQIKKVETLMNTSKPRPKL